MNYEFHGKPTTAKLGLAIMGMIGRHRPDPTATTTAGFLRHIADTIDAARNGEIPDEAAFSRRLGNFLPYRAPSLYQAPVPGPVAAFQHRKNYGPDPIDAESGSFTRIIIISWSQPGEITVVLF